MVTVLPCDIGRGNNNGRRLYAVRYLGLNDMVDRILSNSKTRPYIGATPSSSPQIGLLTEPYTDLYKEQHGVDKKSTLNYILCSNPLI